MAYTPLPDQTGNSGKFLTTNATDPFWNALGATSLGSITTDRLIGRDTAGTGASEELTVSGGIEFTGAGGIRTTAFTGDVTKTAGGTALTIANDAVTFAKFQNIATDRLLGRDTAASGDPEELTVGGGIEFTGSGGIQTSAFTGDVTKAAGGTVTTIANDAVTFAKMQNINTARLLGRSTASSGDVEEISIGSGLSLSGGSLSATGGMGGSGSSGKIAKFTAGTTLGDSIITEASSKIGINTAGPDRMLDILDTAAAQVRMTYTDGSVYTDFRTLSSGIMEVLPTSGTFRVTAPAATHASLEFYADKTHNNSLLFGNNTDGPDFLFYRPANTRNMAVYSYPGSGDLMYWDGTNRRISFGTVNTSPAACVEVRSTGEQLRLLYDASNLFSTTVSSTGTVTFDAIGAGAKFVFSDNIELSDAKNMVFGTTTGTKIGTATTQKIGFFNATPIVQPTVTGSRGGNAALASLCTALANLGLIVNSTS